MLFWLMLKMKQKILKKFKKHSIFAQPCEAPPPPQKKRNTTSPKEKCLVFQKIENLGV